jgi:2,3-bisphosphoglycerate-independent phosphoglycerate mutase
MAIIASPTLRELSTSNNNKIVLLVLDGLGGLPGAEGKTELEAAFTPNLDALAARSELGLSYPIAPGITPGSGPAHLALFGYDALRHNIGRGALSALGVGLPIGKDDVAARINFCTVDANGIITDRRAGRIPTELNRDLCAKLRSIAIPGVEIAIETESQYRAVVVFRGPGLSDKLSDTDPQHTGVAPLVVEPHDPSANATADMVNQFVARARELLHYDHPANMILLRGFARHPDLESIEARLQLHCAAIAVYAMYKGLAQIVGMTVLGNPHTIEEELDLLEQRWNDFDFFYVHVKPTDSAGEDGNFALKQSIIEEVDRQVPRILDLKPAVVIVTGDHSTPSQLKAHSWHALPLLLHSKWVRPEGTPGFSERTAARGSLGTLNHTDVLNLAMSHALRFDKFGA